MTNSAVNNGSGILVRKYGGSSLATFERIRAVAQDIIHSINDGHKLVVVVSAMGGTTDELQALAKQANPNPPRRELDMLLSVGERITASLLSMVLAERGYPAVSFTGSQCGIVTDSSHTDARILYIKGDRVPNALAEGNTVVVAGFQGVSREKEITTLGRGGTDTTAVALADFLGAQRCEILKDVDGVLTADPAVANKVRKHENLSWEELRQIASSGCGVVHIRAVEYAQTHNIPLVIRSSFHNEPGTEVGPKLDTPVCQRESRFRPLSMTVNSDIERLRLLTTDPALGLHWRDLVLKCLDSTDTIAEWLDFGEGFRWETLAPRSCLGDLIEAIAETNKNGSGTIRHDQNMACISLAGGKPDSWLEVQRHINDLLTELRVSGSCLRADGDALRILVPADQLEDLPNQLHKALWLD